MKYQVTQETTLMEFLLEKTQKKRNDIKNLLKYENVSVDGNIETHYAYLLTSGQIVEVGQKKNDSALDIIYEDKEIIVINKPCGLLSEQTDNENQKTAYYLVKQYLAKKKESIFLVHRLDQYTSGLLMFVKTKQLYDLLTRDWNHYVKTRGYIAIVEGMMAKPKGTIDNYLTESKSQNVYITSKENGKRAITHYHQIKTCKKYSLLEVYLDTGRKNQIRVHLSSLHHPIVGDNKYGAKSNPLQRLGLHAHELMFIHPLTHEEKRFVCKTPECFDKLFKKY
ncbi:MAG: RluA family pseudouridine synthase [Coprobacillus sp.]